MDVDPHRLSGVYAVDAMVDDEERREFERHLAGCPDCRQEVRSLRETAAVLAGATAVTPPPGMRRAVLGRIALTPQLPPVTASDLTAPDPTAPDPTVATPPAALPSWPPPSSSLTGPLTIPPTAPPAVPPVVPLSGRRAAGRGPASRPGPYRGRLVAAAAAVVLLAGGGLGSYGALQLQQARAEQQRADRILAIVGDPAGHRVSGTLAGGGTATVVVSRGQAAIVTSGAPALAGGRTYQLWLVRPGQVVSAGLGPAGAEAAGRWDRLIDGVRTGDKVAISVEPAGGSAQPSTTPIGVFPA